MITEREKFSKNICINIKSFNRLRKKKNEHARFCFKNKEKKIEKKMVWVCGVKDGI